LHKKFSQLFFDSKLSDKFWPTQVHFPVISQKIARKQSTYPLHPIIPNNVCTTCLTAAAGTELASAYSTNTVIIFFVKRALQRYCCPLLTLELSMGQAVAYCPKFLTAALRGGLNLLSVSMWLTIFQYQLKIISLASYSLGQKHNHLFAHLQVINLWLFGIPYHLRSLYSDLEGSFRISYSPVRYSIIP